MRKCVSPAANVLALEPLSEARIILETNSGPRSRVWRSPEVIAALDAFAERARRGGLTHHPR
jgi:hypothetical protein